MPEPKFELAVVMPVYNEDEIVGKVIEDWSVKLSSLGIDYKIHAYNDGSKDKTAQVLDLVAANNTRVKVHHKVNSGHGPTILQGYRENTDAQWIFQIDSDNEILPDYFKELWEQRSHYDFLIGERVDRQSPLPRRIISFVALMSVKLLCGSGIQDRVRRCLLPHDVAAERCRGVSPASARDASGAWRFDQVATA